MKTISEQASEAFSGDDSSDFAVTYLNAALDSMRDTVTQLRRTMLLIAFLIFLFELLTRASVREVSIGPFKLSDYSLLYKLMPLAVAYLYYELISIIAMWTMGLTVITEILYILNPEIEEDALVNFLTPYTPFGTAALLINDTEESTWTIWVLRYSITAIAVVLMFGAAAFEVYAFYRCFIEFGPTSVIVWLVLACSLLFVALGLATLRQYNAIL